MGSSQPDRASQPGEQRYRHLFEHMPVCIFVSDLTVNPAVILEVNRRAELVYGYTATELVGKLAIQLVPEESMPAVLLIVQRAQQGERVTTEITNQRRDGTIFPVRVITALDPADSGRLITTVEDITAEKQRRSEADAIDAERRRIAHEIHDGVAQSLAGLRFKSAVWLAGEAVPPGMRAALDEVQAVLNDAIADIRHAIFALRPVDLDTLGFMPALTQWVTDFSDQNQLAVQLVSSGQTDILAPIYELPLLRIVQESLNNISQHSRANLAWVYLTVDVGGSVAVTVRDNGCGFDPSRLSPITQAGHFGLRQMRERILDLGGTLDIRSAIGQGTELRITLPPVAYPIDPLPNNGAAYATD